MVDIKIAILYIGNLVGVFVDIIIVGYCYFSWCKGRYWNCTIVCSTKCNLLPDVFQRRAELRLEQVLGVEEGHDREEASRLVVQAQRVEARHEVLVLEVIGNRFKRLALYGVIERMPVRNSFK